jgi:hypothetical protein
LVILVTQNLFDKYHRKQVTGLLEMVGLAFTRIEVCR